MPAAHLRHLSAVSLLACLPFIGLAFPGGRLVASELPVRELRITPSRILLGGVNRQQQILVTAILMDGREVDVTGEAEYEIDKDSVARVRSSVVYVGRDVIASGKASLQVRFGTHRAQAEVTNSGSDYPAIDFRKDVMPVLSKLGCNSGGCHGKQGGQNGFQLSIFGFDERRDFEALVMEGRGRRVFPAAPTRSLLFSKATGSVPHGGGQRTERDSLDAELLVEWIRQGSPWGSDDAPRLQSIRVFPRERLMRPKSRQQLLITAVYSDGTTRDVTSAAAYTSNAQVVADVDQTGRVGTGTVAGEAAITVNYMGQVGVSRMIVPRRWNAPPLKSLLKGLDHRQPIDRFVGAKLAKLGIKPSGRASDAVFLRRLYLTTIGVLPTAKEIRTFAGDKSQDKRRRAIDAVLARSEFADYWAVQWADVLLVDPTKIGERGAYQFHKWLRTQFATNRPYDEWVRELITATGNSAKYGPVNLFRAQRTPEDLAKTVSQAFLGIRLDCAQCHHHPFEKWGQEDFYGMAGYFTGIQRKALDPQREFVFHQGHQPAKMPISARVVATRPPDGPLLQKGGGDPRVELANWMTSSSNPFFARLVANRLWKHLLGRGLFEPEDDLRSTNPSTNEPLLDHLAARVVATKYNLKAVIKEILLSETFQRSSATNGTNYDDEQNFSHYLKRRLSAHVLLDAISQVTGSPERFPGYPLGTRALQLWDNRLPSYFLDTFGRSLRMSPCACGKSDEPTMAQALHLMNAPEIQAKIEARKGHIAQLISVGKSNRELVDELCFAAVGRPANAREWKTAERLLSQLPRRAAAQDFLWVMLNSYDFLFIR